MSLTRISNVLIKFKCRNNIKLFNIITLLKSEHKKIKNVHNIIEIKLNVCFKNDFSYFSVYKRQCLLVYLCVKLFNLGFEICYIHNFDITNDL